MIMPGPAGSKPDPPTRYTKNPMLPSSELISHRINTPWPSVKAFMRSYSAMAPRTLEFRGDLDCWANAGKHAEHIKMIKRMIETDFFIFYSKKKGLRGRTKPESQTD